jgi:DNA-binding winged helix-turn-helix (wHTH) protein/pimeloyl-ACP methyl ester carboxylesterase
MVFEFADFEIDTEQQELRRAGQVLHVEPQVFDLLVYLVRNRDRLVSKDELLNAIWQGRIVSDAAMSSRIKAARRALGDSGDEQSRIRTIHKRGFRFMGDVHIRHDQGVPREFGPTPAAVMSRTASATGQVNETEDLGERQDVTFCTTSDGVHLAVAAVGQGEPLLKTANWLNHLEYDWQSPIWSPFFRRLAEKRHLIRYDARGNGLSDWDVEEISLDAFVRDLEAVVDHLQLDRFPLLGISQGGAIAIAYAARHPERVTGLVLHGAYALGRNKRGSTAESEKATAWRALIRHGWGDQHSAFMHAFSTLYVPNGTDEQIRWYTELQRVSASGENAIRLRECVDDIDVSHLMSQVHVPALVLHSRHDGVVPFDQGRLLAASLPRARFVGLESDNHLILAHEPAWSQFVAEIEDFLVNLDRAKTNAST